MIPTDIHTGWNYNADDIHLPIQVYSADMPGLTRCNTSLL